LFGDGVGDDAAERVSSAYNLLELDVAELTLSERVGQNASYLDLERALNGLDWIRFVGLANTKAIVDE
jgi:hypothetical protein